MSGHDRRHDVGDLLLVQPLPLRIRQAGREVPVPGHRELGTGGPADDLGPRVGRGDGLAGQRGEPIDQSVEPAVVGGLDGHGLRPDHDLAQDQRDLVAFEPRSGIELVPVEQLVRRNLGRFFVLDVEVPARALPTTAGSLERALSSASRSLICQLSRTSSIGSRSVGSSRSWQTTARSTTSVPLPRGGSSGARPSPPPLPRRARACRGRGCDPLPRRRWDRPRAGRRPRRPRPESVVGPVECVVELVELGLGHPFGGLEQRIGSLQPRGDRRIRLERAGATT